MKKRNSQRLLLKQAILAAAILSGSCRAGFDLLDINQDASSDDDASNSDAGPPLLDAGVDATPADANAACGTSTCGDGICCPEVGESNANCPQDCLAMASCGPCASPTKATCVGGFCDLSCSQTSCDYTVECGAAPDCRVECDNGSDCTVSCLGAIECEVRCRDVGTTCFTDCTGATLCDGPRCRDGAECLLDCTGAITCGYDDCEGGLMSCPGDILACNRACP